MGPMKARNLIAGIIVLGFLGIAGIALTFFIMAASLPQMVTLEDYKPLVVSEMYSRDGEKVGEFYREKRIVIPFEQMPPNLVNAFLAAEDSAFYNHSGINFFAILRALIANFRAGHTVQGGSTITQQTAKSLMLTPHRTLARKIKEAILATRMEKNLSKQDILYLYLNQIYLGHGAYGVQAAAENYYRKKVSDLSLEESAMLAGMAKAPGRFSPLLNPERAKKRQRYVLRRMVEEDFVTQEEASAAAEAPLHCFYRGVFKDVAPFYRETVRQFLVKKLGENKVLDEGIRIHTGMDLKKQTAAQESIEKHLRDVDKRQGFRGAQKNIETAEDIASFLLKERDRLVADQLPYKIINPDGTSVEARPLDLNRNEGNIAMPEYLKLGQVVNAVVTKVDSKWGLVTVRFAESKGLIDLKDMEWARTPDPEKHHTEQPLKDPAEALKVGDVVKVEVFKERFDSPRVAKILRKEKRAFLKKNRKNRKARWERPETLPDFNDYIYAKLEQDPIVESALLSFDLQSADVIAMVGGANFERSEYNRTIQAARQTGSSYKSIIYASALEKGYNPSTVIVDAPIVYEEGEGQETRKWKPGNFGNKFTGDVLFRHSIINSLNIPTVKIIQDIGVEWVAKFSRRLGIFSPLNPDYTTALGSSGTTMYEMLKVFSTFAKNGKRIIPVLIRKVTDASGEEILAENISLDDKFKEQILGLEEEFNPEYARVLRKRYFPDEEVVDVPPQMAPPKPVVAANPVVEQGETSPDADGTVAEVEEPKRDPFKFDDPDQLISPQTAYITTSLLKGVVNEGTGRRARALGKPVAGKTGTTSGYFDAWFSGYTPFVATNVWVGFDNEKPIGKLETGGSAALPIWLDYMKVATEEDPAREFQVPQGIVFANIDVKTGKLASSRTKTVAREAYMEGTEPKVSTNQISEDESKSFLKEDLSN